MLPLDCAIYFTVIFYHDKESPFLLSEGKIEMRKEIKEARSKI